MGKFADAFRNTENAGLTGRRLAATQHPDASMNGPRILKPYPDEFYANYDPKVFDQEKFPAVTIINPAAFHTKVVAAGKVLVYGSSFTGKTTLGVDTLVNSDLVKNGELLIPRRLITRAPRANDNLTENKHITPEELAQISAEKDYTVKWTRRLEGKAETYLFENTKPDEGQILVFPGNNSANEDINVEPKGYFDDAIKIGVYAPDDLRQLRQITRSPDMKEGEVIQRMSDHPFYSLLLGPLDVIVHNYGELEAQAPQDFLKFMETIVETQKVVRAGLTNEP